MSQRGSYLNELVIAYDSTDGQKLLEISIDNDHYLVCMDKAHQFQENRSTCALVSLIIGINGKKLLNHNIYNNPKNNTNNNDLITEEWLLTKYDSYIHSASNISAISKESILKQGLTLVAATNIAIQLGFRTVETVYVNDLIFKTSKQLFLNKIKNMFLCTQTCTCTHTGEGNSENSENGENSDKEGCCVSGRGYKFILCNFKSLNPNVSWGHFSPIGGYCRYNNEDYVLILDTWKPFGKYWIQLDRLWKLMNTVDSDSKQYRGYFIANVSSFKMKD